VDQPVPQVTAVDVERVVRRDFPLAEVSGVLAALEQYGTRDWHREVVRVRLAVLKLANGSHKKLRDFLATADRDYRDVLSYAEYPRYFGEIDPAEQNEPKRRRVIDADWRQYRQWLERGAATSKSTRLGRARPLRSGSSL